MRVYGIALVLLLSGCASGSGVKIWNPLTWGSHQPADKVDQTTAKEERIRDEARKAAQRNVHQTQSALAEAPASRPVAVAKEFNATAVALLDQTEGPLQAGDIAELQKTVTGLLSENAQIRAEAERQRAKDSEKVADVSERLAKAERASDTASAKLRLAFDRENALANQLRNQVALTWIAGGLGLLGFLGWVYVRFALGGVPNAIGKGLAVLRTKNPEAGALATQIFDSYLNRHEQTLIAKSSQ